MSERFWLSLILSSIMRDHSLREIAAGIQMPEKRADYLVDLMTRSMRLLEPTMSYQIVGRFDPVAYTLTLLGKQIANRKRDA